MKKGPRYIKLQEKTLKKQEKAIKFEFKKNKREDKNLPKIKTYF